MGFTETLVEIGSLDEHIQFTMIKINNGGYYHLPHHILTLCNVKWFLCKGKLREISILKTVKGNWLCETKGQNSGMIFILENIMYGNVPLLVSAWLFLGRLPTKFPIVFQTFMRFSQYKYGTLYLLAPIN